MSNDDKVGYKQPPTHTRFRPGVSGNPTGRPKRCPSFRDTLFTQLAAPAAVAGSRPGDSNLQALVTKLVEAAISGDLRAQALVLGALTRFGKSAEQDATTVSADDQEILAAYVESEAEPATVASTPAASERGGEQTSGGADEVGAVAPLDSGPSK